MRAFITGAGSQRSLNDGSRRRILALVAKVLYVVTPLPYPKAYTVCAHDREDGSESKRSGPHSVLREEPLTRAEAKTIPLDAAYGG